jgi:hypothetical protein
MARAAATNHFYAPLLSRRELRHHGDHARARIPTHPVGASRRGAPPASPIVTNAELAPRSL